MTRLGARLALVISSLVPLLCAPVASAQLPVLGVMTEAEVRAALERASAPEPALAQQPTAQEPIAADPALERAALRSQLAARRRAHLEELRRYVAAGEFPANRERPGFLNVFQDDEGHLCAVANLMAWGGELELVRATAARSNFVVLRDVRDGPLLDWILSSGFTQEEIGRIQEPYFFEEQLSSRRAMQRQLEREKERLRRVLGRVIRRLERDEQRSLDLAVARLLTRRSA